MLSVVNFVIPLSLLSGPSFPRIPFLVWSRLSFPRKLPELWKVEVRRSNHPLEAPGGPTRHKGHNGF